MPEDKKVINLPEVVPVKMLAEELGVSPIEIIKKLMQSGVLATLNESVDFDTASIIADEYGFEVQEVKKQQPIREEKVGSGKLKSRPPVVTIMGHVDHGKTKLLDAIRDTNIIETESGGITQHLGAYQTKVESTDKGKKTERVITFLDTPGHEAFSAMRARGANITDIIILVVAADEGVKPQTVEAISHAKAAKVPIIVAINKIDKPEADPDKVKRELSEHKLIPEEWGGKTPMIGVSAKTGQNIKDLLEVVLLAADMAELKADYDKPAVGMVIESKIQPGKGATATVIIQEGTLRSGDVIIYNSDFAKVRFMEDWRGRRIKEAHPSDPILVAGFKKIPKTGAIIEGVADEKTAKQITEKTAKEESIKTIAKSIGLSEISREVQEGKLSELNLIIRTDVKGSLDAIRGSLEEIEAEGIQIKIISDGVGAVTESDVNLALTSKSVVIAYRVPVPPQVLRLADTSKVKISKYDIIYKLIDDIVAALEGMLQPEIVETKIGKLKVLKIFRHQKDRGIVGGLVTSGKITPGTKITAYRDDQVIAELKTEAIQAGHESVNQVSQNDECGISYVGEAKLKPGDILEFTLVEERLRSIKKKTA
jgi:translation initiation factor IF-2